MQLHDTARAVSSPFHIALHSSKKFAVYYTSEETHSRAYMPASISCQRAAISANNFRLKCLPVKGSATLVWSHVACNKKPGVKRRAYPSLLQAIDRGLRTEELDARFEPTRLTLPISPLDERQFRCVSDHAAFSSACRHQVILSGFPISSSIFQIFFRRSSVENPAPVDISGSPLSTAFPRISAIPIRVENRALCEFHFGIPANLCDCLPVFTQLRCAPSRVTCRFTGPIRTPRNRRTHAVLFQMRCQRPRRLWLLQCLRAASSGFERTYGARGRSGARLPCECRSSRECAASGP